ncbi:hypothetical protein DFQ28_006887 [Apophysomyces sp. BC1034]|nr:hypothetical protein DFQ29_006239 [Apophysomyces sp. BC1021]KAG0193003.1 hypothetical protein DFQ28_006887 [Apophysomyces sp. BC1034]
MDYSKQFGRTYTDSVNILDMTTWTWIDKMAQQETLATAAQPGCRFEFPNMPNDNGGGDNGNNAGLPYDPTVISNPGSSDDARAKGLGIGFGLTFVIGCLAGGLFYHVRRLRKDESASNPRWIPSTFIRPKPDKDVSQNKPSPGDQHENDLPLFVYTGSSDRDTTDTGTQRYTAADQVHWEQDVQQDNERPANSQRTTKHLEIWDRLRGLSQGTSDHSAMQSGAVHANGHRIGPTQGYAKLDDI